MVIAFGGFTAGVYVTVHEPDEDNEHEDELNEPPPFPSLQDTDLVGVVGEGELSVTVALNITDPPSVTVAGLCVIDKVVTSRILTVRFEVPELVWCVLSPPYVAVITTLLGEVVDGVYDVVHVSDESMQEEGLKVPPIFPSFQVIVPFRMF